MFYNARWYDSYLNHFTQADTILPDPGSPQAFDRYAYSLNNPLYYTDESGHAPECYSADGMVCKGLGGPGVGTGQPLPINPPEPEPGPDPDPNPEEDPESGENDFTPWVLPMAPTQQGSGSESSYRIQGNWGRGIITTTLQYQATVSVYIEAGPQGLTTTIVIGEAFMLSGLPSDSRDHKALTYATISGEPFHNSNLEIVIGPIGIGGENPIVIGEGPPSPGPPASVNPEPGMPIYPSTKPSARTTTIIISGAIDIRSVDILIRIENTTGATHKDYHIPVK